MPIRCQRHRGGLVRQEGYTHIPASPGLPMLISTRSRRINRKCDWFRQRNRVHFDRPLSRADATRLVSVQIAVSKHSFLPLISFKKKERRYRRQKGVEKPVVSTKIRELAYPSNRDGYVFSFYAERLNALYEAELAARGLTNSVIGYRKGSSNIIRALEAFTEIQTRGNCAAISLDIKGFFDNISHDVLKRCWSFLLGAEFLPLDHYKVFRALTRPGKIDRAELLTRLGYCPKIRDCELPRPLCSVECFRRLRKSASVNSKLVVTCKKDHGIPQGTPLSAAAANISMLEFDTAVKAIVESYGGSYRRYSDDIMLICSAEHINSLEVEVENALKIYTETLSLNAEKREEARFLMPGPTLLPLSSGGSAKPLQYLGFTFNGRQALIRSGTLSRYYRRMINGVRVAKTRANQVKAGKRKGRKVLQKREILARHSHLGAKSFVSSYARFSADTMGNVGRASIRGQMSRHMRVLNHRLRR